MVAIDQLAWIIRHAVNPRRIANSLEALCVLRRRRATGAASLLLVLLVVGCSTPARLPPEAANLTDQTTVLGIPNARFYADTQVAEMAQEALRAVERERAALPRVAGAADRLPAANYLGISGGSDAGAFGAGLLVGWSDAGTRPEFKLVSGVSTGALIAPFAFLGPAYDPQLRAVYTAVQPADIYEQRSMLTAVFSESFADTAPLFSLISRYVNDDLLAAIAREYNKGRLLLIGTTNLDVQRPVIWNIGAIAASGRPGAIELVRKILLASAAVPGLFPPVMIDVEGGGKRFQELHVDGGAVAQMFLYPTSVALHLDTQQKKSLARERRAYLIRNGRMDPEWAATDRRLLSIVGRAISTMIHYSGYNDTLRIYATSQRDGVDYNLAFIGPDFTMPHKEPFDQTYMRTLFDYGYQRGRAGYPWRKAPPILETPVLMKVTDIEGGDLRAPKTDLQADRKNGAVTQAGDGVGRRRVEQFARLRFREGRGAAFLAVDRRPINIHDASSLRTVVRRALGRLPTPEPAWSRGHETMVSKLDAV